jgi:predicted amino acid dehydrogenase
MADFAIIIHPIEISDVYRKLKFLHRWPLPAVEAVTRNLPAFRLSDITGVQSPLAKVSGHFVCCPLTATQMAQLPRDKVLKKIVGAGRIAEKLGAGIVGLGGMTALVSDAGITIAKNLRNAVTTGNSYTVATGLLAARKAAEMMGMDFSRSEVLVVGASIPAGSVCARILARDVRFLTLLTGGKKRLDTLATRIFKESGLAVKVTTDSRRAVQRADILINVTGSDDGFIDAADLKPGAVVCDITRPRDLSRRLAALRDDVFVIEGAVVEVPGKVDFGFDFGFQPGTSSPCMAETMILALEGRFESYTLGTEMSVTQVDEIAGLAARHNFRLSGFRRFESVVDPNQVALIRRNAMRKLSRQKA